MDMDSVFSGSSLQSLAKLLRDAPEEEDDDYDDMVSLSLEFSASFTYYAIAQSG